MDSSYIGEIITVEFDRPPLFSKRPHCPDRFIWRGEVHAIVEVLSQRVDFGRRGDMARNMQPEHAARAAQRGSRGVGRYFRKGGPFREGRQCRVKSSRSADGSGELRAEGSRPPRSRNRTRTRRPSTPPAA